MPLAGSRLGIKSGRLYEQCSLQRFSGADMLSWADGKHAGRSISMTNSIAQTRCRARSARPLLLGVGRRGVHPAQ